MVERTLYSVAERTLYHLSENCMNYRCSSGLYRESLFKAQESRNILVINLCCTFSIFYRTHELVLVRNACVVPCRSSMPSLTQAIITPLDPHLRVESVTAVAKMIVLLIPAKAVLIRLSSFLTRATCPNPPFGRHRRLLPSGTGPTLCALGASCAASQAGLAVVRAPLQATLPNMRALSRHWRIGRRSLMLRYLKPIPGSPTIKTTAQVILAA